MTKRVVFRNGRFVDEETETKKTKKQTTSAPKQVTFDGSKFVDVEQPKPSKPKFVAPVKPKTENKSILEKILSNKGVSSFGRASVSAGEGLLKGIEGATDFAEQRIGDVVGVFSKDAKKAIYDDSKENKVENFGPIKHARDAYDRNAYKSFKSGNIGDSVAQGVGQVASFAAGGEALNGIKGVKALANGGKIAKTASKAIGLAPMFVSSAGQGTSEALNKGASYGKANAYGLGTGAIEAGTESLFGGIGGVVGKGPLDDIVVNAVKKKISSKIGKELAELGIKATGEGLEEVVSGVLNPFLKRATYDKNAENYSLKQAGQDFAVGALTSGILQSPGTINNIVSKENPFVKNSEKQAEKPVVQAKPIEQVQLVQGQQKAPELAVNQSEQTLPVKQKTNDQQIVNSITKKQSNELFSPFDELLTDNELVKTYQNQLQQIFNDYAPSRKMSFAEEEKEISKLTDGLFEGIRQERNKIKQEYQASKPKRVSREEYIKINNEIDKLSEELEKNPDPVKQERLSELFGKVSMNLNEEQSYEDMIMDDLLAKKKKNNYSNETNYNPVKPNQTNTTQHDSIQPKQIAPIGLTKNEQTELSHLTYLSQMPNAMDKADEVRLNELRNKEQAFNERNKKQSIEKQAEQWDRYYQETKTNSEKAKEILIEQRVRTKKENKVIKQYESKTNAEIQQRTKELNKILYFDTRDQKQKFHEVLKNLVNSDLTDDNLKNEVRNQLKANFQEKYFEYINEDLKEAKSVIRKARIKVTDDIKANATDFNNIRKSNFGKVFFSNEGIEADSLYEELSEQYPYIFDEDIINPYDRLERILEVANEQTTTQEKYLLEENVIDSATNYIYSYLKNKQPVEDLINNIDIKKSEVRKEKVAEYREYAASHLDNMAEWKDKSMGIKYQVNTMKRNLYDIMPEKDAQVMYENYFRPITEANVKIDKGISHYNKIVEKLDLTNNEAIALHMLGEYKYNPETQLNADQVNEFLLKHKLDKNKIENAVEVVRNVFDELLPKINAVLKEQGMKEVPYRNGYFPHFTEEKPRTIIGKIAEKVFNWKVEPDQLPTDIAGMTETFRPEKVWTSFSQERKGVNTDYNIHKALDKYLRGAMELIYLTEPAQKLRALETEIRYQHSDIGVQDRYNAIMKDSVLEDGEKEDAIRELFDKVDNPLGRFVTELRSYTDSLLNKKSKADRNMEEKFNRKMYSVINNVTSRYSANTVGGNISSAITNFIPITQMTSQVGITRSLKAITNTFVNMAKSDGISEKSVFIQNRTKKADTLYKSGVQKFSDALGIMFEAVDNVTSNIVVRGKYYENIKKGMSETEALRNADEFAKDLIGGRDKGSMPTIFNEKNALTKVVTMFQLEVANQYNYMFKDMPRDMADEGKHKLVLGFVKMFLLAYLYNEEKEKLTGSRSAFDPVGIVKKLVETYSNEDLSLGDKAATTLETTLREVPFVGSFLGGGRLPISSAKPDLTAILQSKDMGKTALKELRKPAAYLLPPVGGGQIKKTIEGLNMYSKDKEVKGSYTDSGNLRFPVGTKTSDKTKAALFGQYSSKNAREYFDNKLKPIEKEKVKNYKNIPTKEYVKFRIDLRKMNKIESDKDTNGKTIRKSETAKKAHYIMQLNESNSYKNRMLEALMKQNRSKSNLTTKELKNLKTKKDFIEYFWYKN